MTELSTNAQKIFDDVATHLFTQGRRAGKITGDDDEDCKGDAFVCLYRGENGLKCAVGALIPDDLYESGMDMDSNGDMNGVKHARTIVEEYPALSFLQPYSALLMDLQDCHDSQSNWKTEESMKARLRSVANHFDLRSEVLENLHFSHSRLN